MGSRLADLAEGILDSFRCRCFADDLPDGTECPCGGDGRVETNDGAREGNDETETCWHCQAREALADPGPLEVATKALEEIRAMGTVGSCPPFSGGLTRWAAVASRALATIRGGETKSVDEP